MKFKLAFVVSSLLLLAACSATSGPPSGNAPDTLRVVRPVDAYGKHYPAFSTTVTNAAAIQQLYQAAYALPGLLPGNVNCPAGFGLVYHLTFLYHTSVVQVMNLEADGCQNLHIGQSNVRRTTLTFLLLAAKTIGVPSLIPANKT